MLPLGFCSLPFGFCFYATWLLLFFLLLPLFSAFDCQRNFSIRLAVAWNRLAREHQAPWTKRKLWGCDSCELETPGTEPAQNPIGGHEQIMLLLAVECSLLPLLLQLWLLWLLFGSLSCCIANAWLLVHGEGCRRCRRCLSCCCLISSCWCV